MKIDCAPFAHLSDWPVAATALRRVSRLGLFELPRSCAPQFLFNKLRKLKMSSWRMKLCPLSVGNDWRTEAFMNLVHGVRHELRNMILPRCELRHSWPEINASSESACMAGVRLPFCWNMISDVRCASVGTYTRSFAAEPSPLMSLPYTYSYGTPDSPMKLKDTSVLDGKL